MRDAPIIAIRVTLGDKPSVAGFSTGPPGGRPAGAAFQLSPTGAGRSTPDPQEALEAAWRGAAAAFREVSEGAALVAAGNSLGACRK
jgi:hypothetical protein